MKTPIFRGIVAAASLKLVAGRVQLGDLLNLPRHRCRGLIEGRRCRSSARRRGRRIFRGTVAAASLKVFDHAIGPRPLARLPRHRCRGLIEAS